MTTQVSNVAAQPSSTFGEKITGAASKTWKGVKVCAVKTKDFIIKSAMAVFNFMKNGAKVIWNSKPARYTCGALAASGALAGSVFLALFLAKKFKKQEKGTEPKPIDEPKLEELKDDLPIELEAAPLAKPVEEEKSPERLHHFNKERPFQKGRRLPSRLPNTKSKNDIPFDEAEKKGFFSADSHLAQDEIMAQAMQDEEIAKHLQVMQDGKIAKHLQNENKRGVVSKNPVKKGPFNKKLVHVKQSNGTYQPFNCFTRISRPLIKQAVKV